MPQFLWAPAAHGFGRLVLCGSWRAEKYLTKFIICN